MAATNAWGSMEKSEANTSATDSIKAELAVAGDRNLAVTRAEKKNYAEKLSRALASKLAHRLRTAFPGVLPDALGKGQESKARTSKGFKKLDINYSTPELGLGLGVSIKTINFRDGATKRYTKNFTRADAELRAEAADYHERQPYAVMIALIFLPIDACDDGGGKNKSHSSFGGAVQVFRFRAGREKATDPPLLFERVFLGLYEPDAEGSGDVSFFDVMDVPPKNGRPTNCRTLSDVVSEIVKTYDARNRPTFKWADAAPEAVVLPDEADDEEE
jgi:hypothetical protein